MASIRIRKHKVRASEIKRRLKPQNRGGLPPEINVPAPPTYRPKKDAGPGEAALHDEQQVARVEVLMIKGIRNKRQLMVLLEIEDERAIDRYVKRVHARWELYGTTQEHARHRGEGLNRLDLIESEMWSKLSNLDQKASPQIALNYLNALQNVQKQRSELLGLTPKVIAHLGVGAEANLEFSRQAAVHDRLAHVASRMMHMIEDRLNTRTIEHDDER